MMSSRMISTLSRLPGRGSTGVLRASGTVMTSLGRSLASGPGCVGEPVASGVGASCATAAATGSQVPTSAPIQSHGRCVRRPLEESGWLTSAAPGFPPLAACGKGIRNLPVVVCPREPRGRSPQRARTTARFAHGASQGSIGGARGRLQSGSRRRGDLAAHATHAASSRSVSGSLRAAQTAMSFGGFGPACWHIGPG